MKICSYLRVNLLLFFILTLSFQNIYAVTFEQANVIGKYVTFTDLIVRLNKSECGYIFKKNPLPVSAIIEEVKSYLKEEDSKEADIYFNSSEFKEKIKENDTLINGSLSNLKKSGIDSKTACGITVSSLTSINPKNEWEKIKHYLK